MAAKELLSRYAFYLFRVIGDGDLMSYMEELTMVYEIDYTFEFTGWRDADLPRFLRGIDVVVNPTLRGVSETFCIANIEAMSSGIPLITFAVGGIGEYISRPNRMVPVDERDVEVTSNAIILNVASSATIADAVDMLCNNSSLRYELGKNGRRTVSSFFTHERQMDQYTNLYLNFMTT